MMRDIVGAVVVSVLYICDITDASVPVWKLKFIFFRLKSKYHTMQHLLKYSLTNLGIVGFAVMIHQYVKTCAHLLTLFSSNTIVSRILVTMLKRGSTAQHRVIHQSNIASYFVTFVLSRSPKKGFLNAAGRDALK